MSNNSWKQYGGISKMDDFNVINASTIVAEQFISRSTKPIYQYLNGTFEVSLDLSAGVNIIASNSIYTAVDLYVNKNIYSNNKIFFGGNTFVNTGNSFPARPDDTTHAFLYGDLSYVGVNILKPKTIFNVTGTVSGETEIVTFESKNDYVRNILAQNKNERGLVIDASNDITNIYFFNDSSTNVSNSPDAMIRYTKGGYLHMDTSYGISSSSKYNRIDTSGGTIYMDIMKTQVDSSGYIIMNTSGGFMLDTSGSYTHIDRSNGNINIDSSGQYILHSSGGYFLLDNESAVLSSEGRVELHASGGYVEIDSNNGEIVFNSGLVKLNTLLDFTPPERDISTNVLFNETLTVYDNSNSTFLYNVYDNSDILQGTAIAGIGKDPSATTFMRLLPATKLEGAAYGGGLYPYDTSRSMNLLGITDSCGNYVHNQMILASNNKAKYISTVGINTYMPKTEQYTLDINGPTRISNGEINTVAEANFEIIEVAFSNIHPLCGIACGTPSELKNLPNIDPTFTQVLLYTTNGGVSWSRSNIYSNDTGIDDILVNFNTAFMYDEKYGIIAGNSSYIFYTNDGGETWNRMQYYQQGSLVTTDNTYRDANAIEIIEYNNNLRVFIAYRYNDPDGDPVDIYTKQIRYFDIPITSLSTQLNGDTFKISAFSESAVADNINIYGRSSTNNDIYYVGNGILKCNVSDASTVYYTNSSYTYYGVHAYSDNFVVAVGDNIISYTTDGASWTNLSINADTTIGSAVILRSIFIHNEENIVVVGDNGIFAYTRFGPSAVNWEIVPDTILNSSGMSKRLTDITNQLKTIHMLNDFSFIISDVIVPSSNVTDDSNDISGFSKLQYTFLPVLFHRDKNTVLDISGNLMISGNLESIDGRLFVGQNSILQSDVSMNNRLFVAEDVSLNSRLYVQDETILHSDVSMNTRLFVAEDVSFNSRLYVQDETILHSDVSMNTRLYVAGDVSLNRRLFVEERIILPSTSTILSNNYDAYLDGLTTADNPNYSNNINFGHNTQITNIGPVDTVIKTAGALESEDVSLNRLPDDNKMINIGAVNPQTEEDTVTINIGNYSSSLLSKQNKIYVGGGTDLVEMGGNVTFVTTQQLRVNNPLIEINSGSNQYNSSGDSGIIIRDNSNSYAGHILVEHDMKGFSFKAPVQGSHSVTLETQELVLSSSDAVNTDIGINSIDNGLMILTRSYDSGSSTQYDASYSITVAQFDISNVLVRDSNTSNENVQNIVTQLIVQDDVSFNDRLFVLNDVSFNRRLYVMDNSIFEEDVSMNTRLFVAEDVSLNSRLYVQDETILHSDVSMNTRLFVAEDVSFNSRLYVKSNSIFEGDVSMNNRVYIGNDLIIDGNLTVEQYSTKSIINTTTTDYFFIVAEDMSLNGRLMVRDDVSFNSRLFVQDETILHSDVSMNTRLFVAEDVSLNSRLYVQDETILHSDVSMNTRLFVDGDVSFNSRLYVKEYVSIGKTLPLMALDISYSDAIRIPTGTTDERPIKIGGGQTGFQTRENVDLQIIDKNRYIGSIRYNSTNSQFEGFGPGDSWGSLGGVINVAQNTKILASYPNADSTNNELNFFTATAGSIDVNDATERMRITEAGDVSMNFRLFVSDDVSFNSRLYVQDETILHSDVSMNTRLFVAEDVSFNSRLYVQDETILHSDVSMNTRLFVAEDVSFNSRLYVQDETILHSDVSMNTRLFVAEDVSFNSRLYVQDETILHSDVSMNTRLFVAEDVSLNGKLYAKGPMGLGIQQPSVSFEVAYTDAIRIPYGTTVQRPTVTDEATNGGYIRYNTTNHQFEGYGPGDSWGSLGGVINVAQNTKILASYPNADSTNNELIFYTAPENSSDINDTTERMKITSHGDISMNTRLYVSAGYLTVSSGAGTNGDSTIVIESDTDNTNESANPLILMKQDGGNVIYTHGLGTAADRIGGSGVENNILYKMVDNTGTNNTNFSFEHNDNSLLLIQSNGSVGIGTTSPNGLLHLYEATGTTGSADGSGTLVLEHGNDGGHSSIVFASAQNRSSDYGYIRYMDDYLDSTTDERSVLVIGVENDDNSSDGDNIALMPSGNVGINTLFPSTSYKLDVNGDVQGTSFNASSDSRLKNNILSITNGLSIINQLRGVSFEWKNKPGQKTFGVIAQEVEKVVPELVHTNETENEDGFKQKSVHYDGITPYLIESVKILSSENEDLRTEIQQLKSVNELIKEKMKKYDELFQQLTNK